VLIRVAAVALNPCDWKMPTNICPGAGVRSDYWGTVIHFSSAVTTDEFGLTVGTRIAGAVHASNRLNHQFGAFTGYIAVYADQL